MFQQNKILLQFAFLSRGFTTRVMLIRSKQGGTSFMINMNLELYKKSLERNFNLTYSDSSLIAQNQLPIYANYDS